MEKLTEDNIRLKDEERRLKDLVKQLHQEAKRNDHITVDPKADKVEKDQLQVIKVQRNELDRANREINRLEIEINRGLEQISQIGFENENATDLKYERDHLEAKTHQIQLTLKNVRENVDISKNVWNHAKVHDDVSAQKLLALQKENRELSNTNMALKDAADYA